MNAWWIPRKGRIITIMSASPCSLALGEVMLSVQLTPQLEEVVDRLVTSGRYGSKSEVLREGVRLVDERERRQEALAQALAAGMAQADAGQTVSADEVFESLLARYGRRSEVQSGG
jgi:antitoxin ParD1/3/4